MKLSFVTRSAVLVLSGLVPVLGMSAPTVDSGTNIQVVSQGGVTVTIADVDAYMQRIPPEKWAGFVSSAERIETMLKDILRTKMLAAQAVEMNLDKSADAQAQFQRAREEVLAKIRMKEFNSSIKVPDLSQLAKERYLANKDQYVVAASVTAQHILISAKDRTDEAAKALAEEVRAKALAHPDQFDALVKQYSDDPSKDTNNGVMRDASSEKFVSEFAKAAGNLTDTNPISPVVKTKFGYHILKLVSATPARQKSFDEVRQGIVEALKNQYIADQKRNFLTDLAAQKMTPDPAAIASLHDRYFTGAGVPIQAPVKPEAPDSAPAKP